MTAAMDVFAVSDIPCVAEWRLPEHRRPQIFHLSLAFDAPQKRASLRIRVPVSLKTPSKSLYSLYLLVDTDHISSIEEVEEVPEDVTSKLKAEVTGIRLQVEQPGGRIVAPSDVDLMPKTKAAGDILDMLDSFPTATEVSLYFPCKHLSKQRIQSICQVTNEASWKHAPSLSDVSTLYSGRARVIEGPILARSTPGPPVAESPPSYDELGLTPPPPVTKRATGKRRREESPSDQVQVLEDVCRRLLKEKQVEFAVQLEENNAKLLRKVSEENEESRRRTNEDVKEKLEQMEARILAKLEDRLEEKTGQLRGEWKGEVEQIRGELKNEVDHMSGELDDHREALLDETTDLVDVRIDEQLSTAKIELSDWVTEEMRHVENNIWRGLEEVTFSMNV